MIASIALMLYTTQALEGTDCLNDQTVCDATSECCGYVYAPIKYAKKQDFRYRMCATVDATSADGATLLVTTLETGFKFSCTDPQSVWDDSALSLQMAQLLTMVGIAAYLV